MRLNEIVYKINKRLSKKIRESRLFSKNYEFINRSVNSENLFIILAGFQEYYWDGISERVLRSKKYFESESSKNTIDVCVCVPQGEGNIEKLKCICEKNAWSFLYISEDLLAKVQNTAIKLHPSAKWIYKIDEDIIIPENYISDLKKAYISAENTMPVTPALAVPCINVNALGAVSVMRALNIEEEYKSRFGRYAFGAPFGSLYHGDKIHSDPDVGVWIWSHSVPFDEVASVVATANKGRISWCPHRFSIGAILLKREFWELINGFEVGIEGEMGLEEEQVNSFCTAKNTGIYMAEDLFVGHLGFGRQKEAVRGFYEKNKALIIGNNCDTNVIQKLTCQNHSAKV